VIAEAAFEHTQLKKLMIPGRLQYLEAELPFDNGANKV
jgi:hypothetical protein